MVQGGHSLLVHAGDAFHHQAALRVHRIRALDVQAYLLAHHHLGQGFLGGVCRIYRTDILALAQYGHPV